MRTIIVIALIFVFVIAAGLVGILRPALALNPDKSTWEIKQIAGADGLGQYAIHTIRIKGDRKFLLAGIGGTTLDTEPPPAATTVKPPETAQPSAHEPAPSETSKEHGVSPPSTPSTPHDEPRGIGAVPPPVITPGEVPGHGRVKATTGSHKPASKEKFKKLKEKGKTTTGQAKTAKGLKPQPRKTVEKLPAPNTVQKSKSEKRPTPMGVTKSLESK